MKKIIFCCLLLLNISAAYASHDHYSYAYIPISDPQEAGQIKLHKAIFYTWYAEPDFSLSTVTLPYIVNTPHRSTTSQNQYNDMNINLANVPGLEIDLSKLYEKNCSVGINASKVKVRAPDEINIPQNSHTKESLDYLLKFVSKATRLSLEMNQLKCLVEVIR